MNRKILAFVCTLVTSFSANAGTMLQVNSVISDQPLLSGHPLDAGINQSGLSSGYISGITNFDAYTASGVTHDNQAITTFATAAGITSVSLILDLGGSTNIESFALWNRDQIDQGILDFSLTASNDALFTSETLLGGFTAQTANNGSSNGALPEIFTFTATTASFVRMDIDNVYGTCCVSFNELAFEQNVSAVPLPAAAWLFGSGLIGLVGVAKRKKAA